MANFGRALRRVAVLISGYRMMRYPRIVMSSCPHFGMRRVCATSRCYFQQTLRHPHTWKSLISRSGTSKRSRIQDRFRFPFGTAARIGNTCESLRPTPLTSQHVQLHMSIVEQLRDRRTLSATAAPMNEMICTGGQARDASIVVVPASRSRSSDTRPYHRCHSGCNGS
ncbi:hypothetical protein BC826DRAFT_214967 [Russula brevipes]|nr:hypothetical protein BC826DRAFT_214967 [Russula brevipes]